VARLSRPASDDAWLRRSSTRQPHRRAEEMFSPAIAAALRHDAVAGAGYADLRSMTDEEIFGWPDPERIRLFTETVKTSR
jgi:hypothetical protein